MRKLRYWFHFQAHDHVFLQLWGQTCNRILPEKTYDLQIRSNQFKYLILFAVFVMIFNWIARKWLFATLQLISASQPNHCFFVHTSCLTSTCKSINPFSAIESKCFDGNWQEHNRSPNLVSNHVKPAPPRHKCSYKDERRRISQTLDSVFLISSLSLHMCWQIRARLTGFELHRSMWNAKHIKHQNFLKCSLAL